MQVPLGQLRLWWLIICLSGQIIGLQAKLCGPKFNFYPPGAEDRNAPSSWGKTAQIAAGNEADDMVFSVVLTATHNLPQADTASAPLLQVVPSHPLVEPGTVGVSKSCMGFLGADDEDEGAALVDAQDSSSSSSAGEAQAEQQPPAGSNAADGVLQMPDNARRLLMVAASSNTSGSDGGSSSSRSMHWHSWGSDAAEEQYLAATGQQQQQQQQQQQRRRQLLQDGVVTLPAAFRVEYQLNDTKMVRLGEFRQGVTPPFPAITLDDLKSRDDGYYCLTVQLTILAGTGTVGGVAAPLMDLVNTTQVCFYKMDGQPAAKVDFQSCEEAFSVIISEISPPPISLFPGSSQALFTPVMHFFSDLNRTKDGVWPSSEMTTKIEHWLVVDTVRKASKPYIWAPEERLAEGWYNIKLEAGLASDYPMLMPLPPAGSSVLSYSEEKAPEDIKEQSKFYANPQYPNGTVLGVQYKPTQFRFMEGPEGDFFPVNAEISFTWDFEGFGHMYCYIDGKPFENSGEHTCAPPLTMNVPDKKNHTLTVVMQDACGNPNMTVKAAYGTWGYHLLQVPGTDELELGTEGGSGTPSGGPVYDLAASNASAAALRSQRKAVVHSRGSAARSALWQWLGAGMLALAVAHLLPPLLMAGL